MTRVACSKIPGKLEIREIWSDDGARIFARWFARNHPDGTAYVFTKPNALYCGENVSLESLSPLIDFDVYKFMPVWRRINSNII